MERVKNFKYCVTYECNGFRVTNFYDEYTEAMTAFNGLIHNGFIVTYYEYDPVTDKYEKMLECKE